MALFVIFVGVLAAVGVARSLQARVRRAPATAHHRVLDTLDSITQSAAARDAARQASAAPLAGRAAQGGAHQHVRLVAADEVVRGRRSGDVHPPARTSLDIDGAVTTTPAVEGSATHTTLQRSALASGGGPALRRHRRRAGGAPTGRALAVAAATAAAAVVVGAGLVPSGPGHPRPLAHHPSPATAPAAATTPRPTPAPAVTLQSSTPEVSIFAVAARATITFTATGSSWAQLRSGGPSGSVVFEGVLRPGQAETVSGPAWIRLGNPPAVTVAVDGTPVVPPSLASGRPTDLQFG